MEDSLVDEQEAEDRLEEELETQRELQEDLSEEDAREYGAPEPEQIFERFKFLTEVRDRDDTIRTGFVNEEELGRPLFPVRFWNNLKAIAKMHNYDIVSKYCRDKALNITSSSLSRDGFLLNTSVTKRKERLKSKKGYNKGKPKNV